jgi:hypothetical protein
LEEAGIEILREATRYLALNRRHTVAAQKLLETTSDPAYAILRGPDVPMLAGAIRRIQSRQAAMDSATRRVSSAPRDLGAVTDLEDSLDALGLTVMVQCRQFPILYRTWKNLRLTPDVQVDLYSHREPSLAAGTLAGGAAIAEIRKAVFSTLKKAWESNVALRTEINSNSQIVWQFPPLIQAALEDLADADPRFASLSIGAKAAEEYLEIKQTRITSVLTQIIGLLDLAALAASAAPPIGLTLAGISLVLSIADSIVEFFQLRAEDRAFNAVLDPQKTLSLEPSYFGFVLGIAFSLLDVKAVKDALRATRYAREAAELQRLAETGS